MNTGTWFNGQPSTITTTATRATISVHASKGQGRYTDYREGGLKDTHVGWRENATRVVRLHGYTPWERGERLEVRS